MATQLELHPVQTGILKVLLFREYARFSDLNAEKIPSDHFNFHVKKLLDENLIEKTDDGLYKLTVKGKEFANRFDADSATMAIERQAKLGALVICSKTENGVPKYLIQQRLKQPYYGYYGFITGKIKWGETIEETAQRELAEESGLSGTPKLAYIRHKMDYAQTGDLLEDKFFFAQIVRDPTGVTKQEFDGGRNLWLTKQEIQNLPDLFPDVINAIELVERGQFAFIEKKYLVEKY